MQDEQVSPGIEPAAPEPARPAAPTPPADADAAVPAPAEARADAVSSAPQAPFESTEPAAADAPAESIEPAAGGTQETPAQSLRNEAKALLDRLRAENRVFRERLPMALGMHRQLASALGVSGLVARRVCAVHSGSLPYLRHLAAGGARYDLQGNPSGEVTPEQVETARRQAAELLARRAQQHAGPGAARGGKSVQARAVRTAEPVASEPAVRPPRPERTDAAPQAKRAERFSRSPSGQPAGRSPGKGRRGNPPPRGARREAAADELAIAQPASRVEPAAATVRRTEPRRETKADPNARNASALAMALSEAIKAAPTEFAPRVASSTPEAESTTARSQPRERRGRSADRR